MSRSANELAAAGLVRRGGKLFHIECPEPEIPGQSDLFAGRESENVATEAQAWGCTLKYPIGGVS